MTIDQHEYKCPLGAVDRRLSDVHRHWHEAERGYFDPETFRISIQTAIQTLRTVSFILQSNKRIFTNFDPWYETWQSKLRADPLMRWMVDARNKIEKQGDLETHSFVRAEIIASYYEEGPIIEVPAELFQNSANLIDSIQTEELKKHVLKDGILRIQRRWVENSLPDYELLEAVGIAYGKIAELVADAHLELGLQSPSTMVDDVDHTSGRKSRGGRLPCMIGHSDSRSQNIWLATGQEIKLEQKKVEIDLTETVKAAKRYGLDPKEILPSSAVDSESILNNLFATARKMLTIDGSHITIAFLLKGAAMASMVTLNMEEHGEKYLVMRKLADEVIKHGADAVIVIGEVWSARFDASKPYRRAVDSPEKDEFLTGTLVSKFGEPIHLRAKIIRNHSTVTLAETEISRDQAQIAFSPIYLAWGREIPTAWLNILKNQDQ